MIGSSLSEPNAINMSDCIIIIPAHNEEEHIGRIVSRLCELTKNRHTVLVVDDGSFDKTSEKAKQAGALTVRLDNNMGYGYALQAGYAFAAENNFTYLAQMDGDGQHDEAYVEKLFETLRDKNVDFVIGSRFKGRKLGGTYRAGPLRRTGMLFFATLVSFITRQRITDPTSGFRAFKRCMLPVLMHKRYPRDFPDADAIVMLHRNGAIMTEVIVPMYAKRDRKSMHRGWGPFIYAFKMTFSTFQAALQPRIKEIALSK
ncbi:MAG: glycosyltransferase family 2 protein [Thermodesulfobacteriota bacterium]|nr:glycosyltransferase family 2 protein [Thermodesulfobacteriota bacterium]